MNNTNIKEEQMNSKVKKVFRLASIFENDNLVKSSNKIVKKLGKGIIFAGITFANTSCICCSKAGSETLPLCHAPKSVIAGIRNKPHVTITLKLKYLNDIKINNKNNSGIIKTVVSATQIDKELNNTNKQR